MSLRPVSESSPVRDAVSETEWQTRVELAACHRLMAHAGIHDITFIYSKGQEMVQEYFTQSSWYDEELIRRGKTTEAGELERIRGLAHFRFVEQEQQLGDGHAILQAQDHVDTQEPTIVIRFWIIASILAIAGLATLKLR